MFLDFEKEKGARGKTIFICALFGPCGGTHGAREDHFQYHFEVRKSQKVLFHLHDEGGYGTQFEGIPDSGNNFRLVPAYFRGQFRGFRPLTFGIHYRRYPHLGSEFPTF